MQSDVVPGDICKENMVSELYGSGDVPVNETLTQVVKGFGREKEAEDMEIDNAGDGDLRVVSERLGDRKETSSLEGEKGSGEKDTTIVEEKSNDASVSKEGKDIEMGDVKPGGPIKASFDSLAQQILPNPVEDNGCGKDVDLEETADGNPPQFKASLLEAATNMVEVHGIEEGFSDHKGVKVVEGMDDGSVRNDEKDLVKKDGYCVSDLVWGKVRSHPWWPGQIFEPGDASDKAKKYSKSKGYLVGYFWDRTFAWNTEATLKPFAPYFSQMVKQSNLEAFRHAVDCVLDETSRRVEFGLSCRCIADNVYDRLKTQVVENTGIRKQSKIRGGGDRFLNASSFDPMNFLGYVKDLAQGPHIDVDRLEHVVNQAQMAAFYRWKGIYHLAEFGLLIGYVSNEADAPVTAEKEKCEVITDGTPPTGTKTEDGTRPQKRKKSSGDSGQSIKKVVTLSDWVGKKSICKKDIEETEEKAGSKSTPSSVSKRKKAKLVAEDLKTKESSPLESTMQSRDTKPSFRVGESILRVAGQLSQPSPLLKLDKSSRGKSKKDEGNSKRCDNHNSEFASLDAVLSQLHLAAIKPLKERKLLSNMVTFISDFRNSVVPDSELLQKLEDSGEEGTVGKLKEGPIGSGPAEMAEEGCFSGSKSIEMASDSELSTTSDLEAAEDDCCPNKITRVPELQTSFSDVKMAAVEPESSVVDVVSAGSQDVDFSSPQQHNGCENVASEVGQSDENLQQEDSLTALTLKFSDSDSIPTEAKLNEIFSHFGPLKESETVVMAKKSCARVVFKRSSDAETAFSSSGKFEMFGHSLVCYKLDDAPSSHKSPAVEAKRGKKDR